MDIRQARTLQNSENFVLSKIVLRNYFLAELLIPVIKRKVSTKFKVIFGKLNFNGISTGADLTKIVKIMYYLKLC